MSGRVRGPGRARTTEIDVAPWWRAADLGLLALLVIAGSALVNRRRPAAETLDDAAPCPAPVAAGA